MSNNAASDMSEEAEEKVWSIYRMSNNAAPNMPEEGEEKV